MICATRKGFEPSRAKHIGLAVQHLNHSVTSPVYVCNKYLAYYFII